MTSGCWGRRCWPRPVVETGDKRDVYLPAGRWYDVNRGSVIKGPRRLAGYAAPLGVSPAFVRLGAKGAGDAITALRRPRG